jgi:predicted DNA-binding transcriptional regulator AlpA
MNAITSNHRPASPTAKPKAKSKRLKPSPGESPWYRKSDLMRLLQVSDRTIEKWTAMGRIPEPVRKGRGWVRWPKDRIDALIAEWLEGGAA